MSTATKLIKTYNQLPPQVKQSINNVAARAAQAAVRQVQTRATRNRQSQARSRTTRTRNGMRIYSPNDVIETKSIAPVSYATTWTSGNRSLRVHQTEVIGRVSANSTLFPSWNANYSVATFPLNPANPKTFPWLSYIARLYDKYRFHSLRFVYVNSVSTQTAGNIMLSLDYDTLDAAPANLVEASQLAKYKVSPMYCPCDFTIPVTHPGNNSWLYTFDLNAVNSTVDLKTYNLGNLFFSLDGVPQDGKDYGYLAVEYDVELLDKNPVIGTFASKTWDSGNPVLKKARSNVDPADTMELTVEWTTPSSSYSNTATITFPDDVAIGTKCRVLLTVVAPMNSASSANNNTGMRTVTPGDSVTVLGTEYSYAYSSNNIGKITCTCTVNLDITIQSSTATVTFGADGTYMTASSESGNYKYLAMAYTYA